MGLFRLFHGKKMKMLEGIKGPKPHFPLGSATKLLGPMLLEGKQPWEVTAEFAEKYGPLSILWMGGSPSLILNDGALVADVLVRGMEDFYKDSPVKALIPVVTDKSPFVLNGQAWWDARHGDPFTQDWFPAWLSERMPVVRDYMRQRAAQLVGQQVDLYPAIERLCFDVFSQALMGKELGDEAYNCFKKMSDVGSKRINAVLPLPKNPLSLSFPGVKRQWYGIFQKIAEGTRANPDPQATDFINLVLVKQPQFTDQQIAIMLGNVYFGGCFSAASAVASNLYLMAQNEDQAAPLRVLATALGKDYSYEQLMAVSHLNYSLMESLRILPPVPLYTRNSLKDKEVRFQGYTLPENTAMFISNWLIQRSDKFWDNGLSFLPERWGNGVLEANPIGSNKFFPFGMGPRMCMGRPFALMVMRTMLAEFYAAGKVSTQGTYKMKFYFGVMLPEGLTASFSASASQ